MKARIYQMSLERDDKGVCFRDLETVRASGGGAIPAAAYDMVYEYDRASENPEDLFYIFNVEHPADFRGRSMSMSDVVELVDPMKGSKFFFCDTFGFKEVSFDASLAHRGPGMDEMRDVERLTPSSKIRFKCTGCAECCRHVKQIVPVDIQDVMRIAKHLRDHGADIFCTDQFLERYAEPVLINECGYFVYFLKSVGDDDACIFLRNNRCSIHSVKPRACRLYPFLVEPSESGKHRYLFTKERTHHFRGPVIETKAWMKKNFPKEDRAFMQADYAKVRTIAQLLKTIPDTRKTESMFQFQRLLYSEYDLDKPFLEQFLRNQDKLIAILTGMAKENK